MGRRHFLPLVPKDSAPAPQTATHMLIATATPTGLRIRYHARSGGAWLPWQDESGVAGTTGLNRSIEAIQIELVNPPAGANIKYRVHVRFQGWLDWSNAGGVAGKPGEGLHIEAI